MTAIEEITDLKGKVETLAKERDELTAAVVNHNEALKASVAAVEAALADNAKLKADLTAAAEASAKVTAEAAGKITALESDLAQAKGLLRDPAIAVVKAAVPSNAVPVGAEGGASVKTREQWNAEYDALPSKTRADAQARAEFRQAHKAELGL